MEREQGSADVVVVGSGAGGAVVAKELGESGLSVVVLEAGRRFQPEEYPTDRNDFEILGPETFPAKNPDRDRFTSSGSFGIHRVKGVGGSTLHYLAISPRLHESDFTLRSREGIAVDWPIRYDDLEPYYTRVEYELGVSGPDGEEGNPFEPRRSKRFPTPPHPFNKASQRIRKGAEGLGLHFYREAIAIPTLDWGGRKACISAGTCALGCRISAKSSMDVTYIPKAEATGRVEIRPECMAREISVGGDGKARGVIYFDPQGREREVGARAVVVAGNAIETPRLLLLSRSRLFPDGLGNSSGLVGKYFTEHLGIFVTGLFSEPLDPWRGVPTGGMIQDYYETNPKHDFARGWSIVVDLDGYQWPHSVARRVKGWGAEHKKRTKELFGSAITLASIAEQLPDVRNEVRLDPFVRDAYGIPVPFVVSEARENDRRMIRKISESQEDILKAAGAHEVWVGSYQAGSSSHYMGSCRMGADPKTSVVDAWCRSHDVPNLFLADGSVFPTGGSVNPALTISALATRTSEGILRAFQAGEL